MNKHKRKQRGATVLQVLGAGASAGEMNRFLPIDRMGYNVEGGVDADSDSDDCKRRQRQVSHMQETEDSDSEKPTAERHLRQRGECEDGEGSSRL